MTLDRVRDADEVFGQDVFDIFCPFLHGLKDADVSQYNALMGDVDPELLLQGFALQDIRRGQVVSHANHQNWVQFTA